MVSHLHQNYPDMVVEPSTLIAAPLAADIGSTPSGVRFFRPVTCLRRHDQPARTAPQLHDDVQQKDAIHFHCAVPCSQPEPTLLDPSDSDSADDAASDDDDGPRTSRAAADEKADARSHGADGRRSGAGHVAVGSAIAAFKDTAASLAGAGDWTPKKAPTREARRGAVGAQGIDIPQLVIVTTPTVHACANILLFLVVRTVLIAAAVCAHGVLQLITKLGPFPRKGDIDRQRLKSMVLAGARCVSVSLCLDCAMTALLASRDVTIVTMPSSCGLVCWWVWL
jgi:hypothetical protein